MERWEESEASPATSHPCGNRVESVGGLFKVVIHSLGREESPCVKKIFTCWECGILEEYWGRKSESAIEERSQQLVWFLLHTSKAPKIKQLLYFYILKWSIHKNNSFGATDSVFAVNQVNVDDSGEKKHMSLTTYVYICVYLYMCITNIHSE